jgi:hypothetical protein
MNKCLLLSKKILKPEMEPIPVTGRSGTGLSVDRPVTGRPFSCRSTGPVRSDRLGPVPVVKNPDRFHLCLKLSFLERGCGCEGVNVFIIMISRTYTYTLKIGGIFSWHRNQKRDSFQKIEFVLCSSKRSFRKRKLEYQANLNAIFFSIQNFNQRYFNSQTR